MGDPSPETKTGSIATAKTTSSASRKPTDTASAASRLNPDAKDYVPRSPHAITGSSSSSPAVDGGNTRGPRHRRKRNPEGGHSKPNAADGTNKPEASNGHVDSVNGSDATKSTQDGKSRRNNTSRRNNRPGAASSSAKSKDSEGGFSRIDDVQQDDDIEINMDRPLPQRADAATAAAAGSESAVATTTTGSGSGRPAAAPKDRRRERARKGKEISDSPSTRSNQPSSRAGENSRSMRSTTGAGQAEEGASSSSNRASSSANASGSGNNRRQRNRKTGDLGGRTFPRIDQEAGPSSSSAPVSASAAAASRAPKRDTRRPPARYVHKVEEDRDLLTALTQGLTSSTYECMVCWDVIRPAHKIWNCQVCWAAFHLDCLSKWATKSSQDTGATQAGWRCPGCQNTQVSIPRDYQCFCGKAHNPEYNRYITPHACGELSHAIQARAHRVVAKAQSNPVTAATRRFSCAASRPILLFRRANRVAKCVRNFWAAASTLVPLFVMLDCVHRVRYRRSNSAIVANIAEQRVVAMVNQRRCWSMVKSRLVITSVVMSDQEFGECPSMPERVTTCPCGSKTVDVLLKGNSRTSCTDPIPVCGGVCKKNLSCGHRCMQKCHLGKCSPCRVVVSVDCRCGSTQIQRVCSEMVMFGDEAPKCDRPCRALRGCGKHQCTNRCCPAKNPNKTKKHDMAAHEAHVCTLVCGKKLQCGVHTCEMLCHKGHCNPCLISKQCMCRKSRMPNVACYLSNPSCGKTCGKRLDCDHICNKSCHSGECAAPPNEACVQPCQKPRKSCGHRCGVTCHGSEPCAEDQPCQVKVASSCKCGHLAMESPCNATTESPLDGKLRVIKCNDYCLIAERNKRVALALDIDETATKGPRIPEYSVYLLDYASVNMEFTLKIEKQLAEWVADTAKPILYFPPMKGHRRKFVHELASHYDVTSESVDVEPYRSVTVRRLQDTSVPDFLLSRACRNKRPPLAVTSTVGVEQLRKPTVKDPVNAIYLHDLAFGLTRTELAVQLAPIFGNIKYGIRWLTDDDAVLVPHPGSMQMDELEVVLVRLRAGIKALATKSDLCERSNAWLKKPAPPKVENAFALLDEDERIAAAKKAEEEKIFKAKEAAGTLSMEAWEEESTHSSSALKSVTVASAAPVVSSSMVAEGSSSSSSTDKPTALDVSEDLTKFVVVEAGEFTGEVVDDWQELLDEEEEEEEEKKEEGKDLEMESESKAEAKAPSVEGDDSNEKVEVGSAVDAANRLIKITSDDEVVVVSQVEKLDN
ncbi:FKBP12-associated protein [Lunasporangiospora selenospora]|uniref:FKBP12-associated protein n=1 Tax=Lunasporangiospora selenospora TaxID=979761 RepID=A0A9P6FWU3_9FUNG|nr:FKBP12-associated protein [Lunasporangiospora selenospora]